MKNQFQIMGERLREIRLTLDISTAEMARVTGVTEEEYLLHESGVVDSSFAFLLRCAERFGIDIGALVSGASPRLSVYNITRAGHGLPIKRRRNLNYHHLAPFLKDRKVDPLFVKAQYNDGKKSIPLEKHGGQEFDYVISGRLRMQIGEHIEELYPGDSILFDANHPHGMVAVDPEGCEFLAIPIKGEGDGDMLEFKSDTKISSAAKRKLICEEFIEETLDANGHLQSIKFHYPDNFNFAYDVVDVIAERNPDKRAMLWVSRNDEKKEFSFKDISVESKRAANYFASLGIKKGDRVMLVLRRNYQFWIIINALHRIGAVVVPASNQLLTKDFVYRFDSANIAAVVCSVDGTITDYADEAAKKCPGVKNLISVDGSYKNWRNFDAEYTAFAPEFERPADLKATDPSIMFFSSGTTGFPKSVIHCFTYPLGHIVTARWWQCVDPDGLHLTISDTGWAKALWGKIYGQWLNECAVMVYDFDRFDAAKIMPLFAECGITSFCAPPTMYRFFIREDLSKYDFSGLQHAAIAGEALNPEVYHQFYRATGVKLMEGFGQTETTMVLGNVAGMNPKPGSMGKPNPQ
ncbi:MAG: AMP-binding protein, partial [Lentisphaeria bacterium]|nr:AMP-binding protein [Lentisphaeria bacterium]